MIYLFLGVYTVLAILVYIMFKVLRKSVDKIDEQSKTYYVNKLQEYDDIIDNKEAKLKNLDEELKNKLAEIENIKNVDISNREDFDISIIDSLTKTDYRDKTLFELEKIVNEKWKYDNEKIIEEFVKATEKTLENYDFCKKFKRKFIVNSLYDFKVLNKKELDDKLKGMLTEKEYSLLCAYKKTHKRFVIDEFILFLNELVTLNNPNMIVYVGTKEENYDYMSKHIKTKYDSSIYRGIKISYQGKIYDFSLNGRNL